ncbi:MAG: 3-keto-5-aminohexanoate cleavage protein [Robiginitomaculum sp.]|nr:3-keto-5-aminohexanoate cleavage protein [Robiginitomaculum sp.]MDQ7077099.1 3-keto-5-aminohexanoate cleavage protein [Robiginitomaculum sp.]
MPDPFIIMSAPNGARRQKSDHPALPITPRELAECAVQVSGAGASILHLHVRDENNQHSLDVERYRAAIRAIREAVGDDLVIQVTSEAVGKYNRFEQMDMVKRLKPQAVSLALREICPTDAALGEVEDFIRWISDERIFPQYILYNEADYTRFESYRKKGVFQHDSPFVLFVLGRYQGAESPESMSSTGFLKKIQQASVPWAVCGFADNERHAIAFAAKQGGHVRVGFENNILQENKALLEDHTVMIKACVEAAQRERRATASPIDVKNMLKIG